MSKRHWRLGVALLVVIVLLTAGSLTLFGTRSPAVKGWSDSSLDVVGGPIESGGVVVVLDVRAKHLELTGVKGSDGRVLWRHPYSASAVVSGESFSPAVLGGIVLDLAPADTKDALVRPEGIVARTGTIAWSLPHPVVLTDAPDVCGNEYFCLAGHTTGTSTALLMLSPPTGSVVHVLAGPSRALISPPSGSSNDGELWQTDASQPTLLQLSPAGAVSWTQPVSRVFGGTEYSPTDGWFFEAHGALDVGSVGIAPDGTTLAVTSAKTVGLSSRSGTVQWSTDGEYMCGGSLAVLAAPVVCRYSGAVQRKGSSITFSNAGLTLEGIDLATGRVTWSHTVRNPRPLTVGTGVVVEDPTHLVVRLASGARVLLDVRSGATSSIRPGEHFWCQRTPRYQVVATPADTSGTRTGMPVYGACSASGSRVGHAPHDAPATVGRSVGPLFVWPSTHGLRATALQG